MRRGKSGMSKCRELSHWPKIGPAKWILARIPIKCRFWGIQNGLLQKVTTNLGSESLGMRYATPDKKRILEAEIHQAQDPLLSEMGSNLLGFPQKKTSHPTHKKTRGAFRIYIIFVGILWHPKNCLSCDFSLPNFLVKGLPSHWCIMNFAVKGPQNVPGTMWTG